MIRIDIDSGHLLAWYRGGRLFRNSRNCRPSKTQKQSCAVLTEPARTYVGASFCQRDSGLPRAGAAANKDGTTGS
jgi:hypothetical protein